MQKTGVLLTGCLLFSFASLCQDTLKPTFKTYWKQGFHVESQNGNFALKFGGRIMNDWAFYSQEKAVQEEVGKLYGGTEFRRVRFFNSGTFYNSFSYKLQLDFAGGIADAKDIYIRSPKIPYVGEFTVGHMKEPFGMEQLTSSKYITFMERSLTELFAPGRNTGVQLNNHFIDERLSWGAGIFRSTNDFGEALGQPDYYNLTGRVYGLPLYNEENHQIAHLGIAYSHKTPNHRTYSTSIGPESHMAPDYISTPLIQNVQSVQKVGYEGALFWGPFSFQGEFMSATVNTDTTASGYLFSSYYGMISFFITGDHRSYDVGDGTGDRLHPKRNFIQDKGGLGAIELTLRYSSADLNDNNVEGGSLSDITAGVNWYPNPSTKVMLNYQYVQLKQAGFTHIIQTRFQVDF